jgi:hypothetical protein
MRAWLACGNPIVALAGKLAPLFAIFFVMMLSVVLILEGLLGIALAELGPHRIAGRNGDDHVDHHRQQRAEQELRVVALRVDQRDDLGDERPDARGLWRSARGRPVDGGREAIAQAG